MKQALVSLPWSAGSQPQVPCWRGRIRQAIVIACALATTLTAPATAQQSAPQVPAPPAEIGPAKAFSMLERNCAGCHQAGRLGSAAPGGGIANLLVLDEVARDPTLVRPGVPDASRIYSIAQTRELHLDALNDPAASEPTALELQALRYWIADLPPRSLGACARRPRLTAELATARLKAALDRSPAETARQTRFVSLVNLYNDCATWAELDGLRQGLRQTLADLVPADQPARDAAWPPAIDPEQLILAVPLSALGWTPDDWDKLAADYPLRDAMKLPRPMLELVGTSTPVLTADWLAHALLAKRTDQATDDRRTGGQSGSLVWGLPAIHALRHAWNRPADFNRAAADLWLEPAELTKRLSAAPFGTALAARQLRSGSVARRALLLPLLAALTNDTPVTALPTGDPETQHHDIALWLDADTYRSGDQATFNIATSRDCHLTLISVDRVGRATVLYPNEFEPENLIKAGRPITVPALDAPYRFRFKEKGRELAIAICSTTHKAPPGVLHDYERLRFTMLGDWQLFLREPPESREARRDDAATDMPRPQITQRRRGRSKEPAKPDVQPPIADIQTRTAITIDVE